MQMKITSYSGFVHFYPFWGKHPQTFSRLPQPTDYIGSGCHYPRDAFWKVSETFSQGQGDGETKATSSLS